MESCNYFPLGNIERIDFDDFGLENLLDDNDDYSGQLLRSDFNFASLNMPIQPDSVIMPVFDGTNTFSAKSPWHDSDSGVSDSLNYQVTSPDPTLEANIKEMELLVVDADILNDRHLFLQSMSNTNSADDLMSYQCSKTDSQKLTEKTNSEASCESADVSASGRPLRTCQKRKLCNTGIEYPDSNHHFDQKKVAIIKIVKPPTCTSDSMTEDVMRAPDERSRKNAQQAKINREKKKVYIKKLEDDREKLTQENNKLFSQLKQMTEVTKKLEVEVDYLKSVLVNASDLSRLLTNISNVKEVKLSASIMSHSKGNENDHSYNSVRSTQDKTLQTRSDHLKDAGVCLHVSDGEACLEFCANCAVLAHKTRASCC